MQERKQMAESLDRYYRILGLKHGASMELVKRAYRRLALRYHPDKNPGDEQRAARIFTAVNKAYSVLMNVAHLEEPLDNIDDINEAKLYFRRHFHDLACRLNSDDHLSAVVHQEECDFFFRYQLEHVRCVRRSIIEGRRIIDLIKKAVSKGYDISDIIKDHSDFFNKHGFDGQPEYDVYEELIMEYKQTIENDPGDAEAHYNLGCVYEKKGMIDSAISEYQIASHIDPDNIIARQAAKRLRAKRKTAI
jgi:tetratricopeptide (TPR) repeat protein